MKSNSNKNLIDAAMEPVEHPVGDAGIFQQVLRAGDEIVEVEPAARRLGPPSTGRHTRTREPAHLVGGQCKG